MYKNISYFVVIEPLYTQDLLKLCDMWYQFSTHSWTKGRLL